MFYSVKQEGFAGCKQAQWIHRNAWVAHVAASGIGLGTYVKKEKKKIGKRRLTSNSGYANVTERFSPFDPSAIYLRNKVYLGSFGGFCVSWQLFHANDSHRSDAGHASALATATV